MNDAVLLRPFEKEDLPMLYTYYQDNNIIILNAGVPHVVSKRHMEDLYNRLTTKDSRYNFFAIETNGKLIGLGSLISSKSNPYFQQFGITIYDRESWNKGFGTQVTKLLLHYGFHYLGARRIQLLTNSKNPRAIRCFEKCGFVHEGRDREAFWLDGEFADRVRMSIKRDEWEVANA